MAHQQPDSNRVSFTDLPSEIRNQIYEDYLEDVDKTTLRFCDGALLPPALTRASSLVRREFMSSWTSLRDFSVTRRIAARIIDLDFRPRVTFFDDVSNRRIVRSDIVMVFTAEFKSGKVPKDGSLGDYTRRMRRIRVLKVRRRFSLG